jgi:hypothetical protein
MAGAGNYPIERTLSGIQYLIPARGRLVGPKLAPVELGMSITR